MIMKKIRCFIVTFFAICALYGCKSTQYVPIKETRIDTVYKALKDSIRWINHTNIKDSTRIKDSIVIHINDKGEVTGKDTYHWMEKYHNEKDSTSYYKSKCDSLQKLSSDTIEKPVYVEKQLTKVQKCFLWVGKIASVLIALLLILGTIKAGLWVRKKFNL